MHGVILLDAIGLLNPVLWRAVVCPLARFFRSRLRHDQLLRQWLHRALAHIYTGPFEDTRSFRNHAWLRFTYMFDDTIIDYLQTHPYNRHHP